MYQKPIHLVLVVLDLLVVLIAQVLYVPLVAEVHVVVHVMDLFVVANVKSKNKESIKFFLAITKTFYDKIVIIEGFCYSKKKNPVYQVQMTKKCKRQILRLPLNLTPLL